MPHCIIEHSSALNGEMLALQVHKGAMESGLFEIDGSDIKVRALEYSNYRVGGLRSGFVHVTLRILSGRTLYQKTLLTKSVQAAINEMLLESCSITIEVVDIERASYLKWFS